MCFQTNRHRWAWLAAAVVACGCARSEPGPAPDADAMPTVPTSTTTKINSSPVEAESVPPPATRLATATAAAIATPDDDDRDTSENKTPTAKEAFVASNATMAEYLKGVPLIPRTVLFGNPDRAAARLSPDAARLSYLAPVNGVLNVWVGPVDDYKAAKPVTSDKKRGIRIYFWAFTSKHILYMQDSDGDENWHVYSVNLESGETKDLTPLEKVNAQIEAVSHRFPEEILIGLNDRDERLHDIYKVNITTGERELVEQNDEGFVGYISDDDYHVRFASQFLPDGGNQLLEPDGAGGWKEFLTIPYEDTMTSSPAGFNKSGDVLYFIDSRKRNTGALTAIDLSTGNSTLIAANDKADIGGVLAHPTEYTIEAVSFTYERQEWEVLDEEVGKDLDTLRKVADGEIEVVSRSLDDKHWIVAYLMDNGPIRYYRYERPEREATFLFANRDDLGEWPLQKMHSVVIPARDGLPLVSYYTLPPGTDTDADGRPSSPLPMVLDVHGGPWARDTWGYNPTHQLLANRGYAVLSVNYRGSTGFGKKFVNAGNKEWAGKMHTDLLDAVAWAEKEKIADPKRVAITGGSYGGYATLVGLTMTPEEFACGVDIVGPSSIITLLSTIPPYWEPAIQMFKDRVGDPSTVEGKKFLLERSPLSHVDAIRRPLLIGQGANDPRVKQAEADQIVKAMQQKNIPVTYVLYPDEGHGFARPENSLSFNAVTEAFLAEHLGGRYEPVGDDFKGSTIEVPTGASQVPGLSAALEETGTGTK